MFSRISGQDNERLGRSHTHMMAETLKPIICERIVSGSLVHTNEHKSYSNMYGKGNVYKAACHKYTFVKKKQVFIHKVEQVLKSKKRKGITTTCQAALLDEFICLWNHEGNEY
jgi:hypothetical protein